MVFGSLIPTPTKELELLVGVEVYQKLNEILVSDGTPKTKLRQSEAVLNTLPDDVLKRLPFPKQLMPLPEEDRKRVHAILIDKTINYEVKFGQIKAIVMDQEEEIRRKCMPPEPVGFKYFPAELKSKIVELGRDMSLSTLDRFEKSQALIDSLPEAVKALIKNKNCDDDKNEKV
uniref:Reverse transcriptase domain-containing protein n=1 Tax=Rhabditophanes sp. KR3021 TaxID=114890 RepID=A0AC35UAB1_9BILA